MRSRRKSKKSFSILGALSIFLFIILIVGGGASFFLFYENQAPTISMKKINFFGKESNINFSIADAGNGLKSITVTAEQDGISKDLYSKVYDRNGFIGQVGPEKENQQVSFSPQKLGFKDGSVNITITTHDFSCRNFFSGNKTEIIETITIDTKAPKIRLIHSDQYVSSGGSGIVIYKIDDPDSLSGAVINGEFHKGFPIGDGRKNVFISYFAIPYNTTALDELRITAKDEAGNSTSINFQTNFKKKPKVKDRINISDGFLNKKIPEFEENSTYDMQGRDVEKYVFINNKMRTDNNNTIANLCKKSNSTRLWDGRFIRMAGASPAGFAEHRSYYYGNKIIDKQVHLGMDLASTKHAPVKAANHGIIIFAEYLGIYGNMVLIDHGQGLFSLYSHLSQINVEVGDEVKKGFVVGKTGKSGMAGGDHLHFSILVNGIFTTPKEWWDASWIKNNIDEPILDSKF